MDRSGDNSSIRLTNKTALALRKSARQERSMALIMASIMTAFLAALAVLIGIRWLLAVPLITALTVLMDAAIVVRARSRYQMLTGQAICAEAAARQLRMERREKDRRAQAKRDLDDVKADVMSAALRAQRAIEEEEETEGNFNSPVVSSGAQKEIRIREIQREQALREEDERDDARQQDDLPRISVRRRRRQAPLTVLRSEDVK